MRPHRPRRAEPLRPVNGGAEGERGDRPNARRADQPPTHFLLADDVENLLGQAGELLQHDAEDRKKWLDHCHHLGVGQLTEASPTG